MTAGDHTLRVDFVGTSGVTPVADPKSSRKPPASSLERVTYSDLWPGITLSYQRAAGGIVESTYRLEPGADAAQIRLHYDAPLEIEAGGSLRIQYPTGYLRESAPIAWQDIDGQRLPVEVSFRLPESPNRESMLGFSLGQHNPAYPVMIDPVVEWNTALEEGIWDIAYALALDDGGNAYLAGHSEEFWETPELIGTNPYGGAEDALVAKLDSNGAVEWYTFIGGGPAIMYPHTEGTTAYAVAVDGGGNVVVGGFSWCPWAAEPVNQHSGYFVEGADAFVAKLNNSGELIWHTFMGAVDRGYSVQDLALDGSGNIYVFGSMEEGPTGLRDAFLTKLSNSGDVVWGVSLGSSGEDDTAGGVELDGDGNIYVTGTTSASWGLPNPKRPFSDYDDAFVAKLSASGSLVWHTYLGSSLPDGAGGIALDGDGNVYVSGSSWDSWGSPDPLNPHSGRNDAFVAKLDGSGNLLWYTFMGSPQTDYGTDISVYGSDRVYVVGQSDQSWGSPDPYPYQGGDSDAFVARLNGSGNLLWNAFIGTSYADSARAVATRGINSVYVGGSSAAFAFVAKLVPDDDGDGVLNPEDNCVDTENADQADSDMDGYGNLCDADYDNDGTVLGSDFLIFKSRFNATFPYGSDDNGNFEESDHDCDTAIAGSDFITFKLLFNHPPGPSGLTCAGQGSESNPCPATAHGCVFSP